jgi:site-specific DNA-methyltransferase (adenine-specific)
MKMGGQYFKQHQGKRWDDKTPDETYFKELSRVSINQIIWGANYFTLPPTRGIVAWTKTNELQDRTFSEWEMAWTSFDTPARWINMKPFQRNGSRIHPTQKPINLYKWLLKNYAKEGDRILDTHLGSGSSAIAAFDGGFDFVGCEIDKDYFDAAKKRFDIHCMQQKLF